jgi:hypothetical protein
MPLSNAEKQRRWRDRNQIVLTDRAADIAEKLIDMRDQAKLKKIVRYLNDHLKHPDRNPVQRAIALGRAGVDGLNGRLGKKAAIESLRDRPPGEMPVQSSWRVEAITKDGRRWTNGVRLCSKEEAETYRDHHVRFDLDKAGYVTADVLQDDDPSNCGITRKRRGGRPSLGFEDGQCVLLHWHCGGECINVKTY